MHEQNSNALTEVVLGLESLLEPPEHNEMERALGYTGRPSSWSRAGLPFASRLEAPQ